MEHPPRLNYSFAPRRIERLKATPEFRDIATSTKKGKERDEEIRYGKSVQRDNPCLARRHGLADYLPRPGRVPPEARSALHGDDSIPVVLLGRVMDALSERDEICRCRPQTRRGARNPIHERG